MTRTSALPADHDDLDSFEADDEFTFPSTPSERPLPSLAELEGDPYAPEGHDPFAIPSTPSERPLPSLAELEGDPYAPEGHDPFAPTGERPLPSLAELEGDPYAPEGHDGFDAPVPALASPDAFGPADPFAALDRAIEAHAEHGREEDLEDEEVEPPPAPAMNPVGAMIAGVEAALGDVDVPRIAIHIFCQRPDTAAVAEKASTDRRLARATTLVRAGGLAEALDVYRNTPTPSLVMVESLDPAETLLAGLDRLAEVCDPGTKVVVIGNANDIGLYRELMRRGVSEYLVPPLQPLQMIRTISSLYADPATPFTGRTMAFVGAKGGVGSSSLAHNFAWVLSEHVQASTCIVDYDLPFGTAGLDFNQDPVQGLADALQKPDRLDPVLMDRMTARCTDRLSLFAAPATLDDDWEIGAHAYEEVGRKIRASAPYVVLDLPHIWSGWMRATLMGADDVVIVAAPDLASLRNAKNMIDLLKRGRPNDAPPRLIVNQVGLPGRPEIPIKEFSKALGVEPSLVLPFDAKLFGQAANNGQMIFEVNPKAKAAEGLMAFAQALSRREVVAQKPKSLLERLTKRA